MKNVNDTPVTVTAVGRDERGNNYVVVNFRDLHGQSRREAMPLRLLGAGPQPVIAYLADLGYPPPLLTASRQRVLACFDSLESLPSVPIATRTGCYGDDTFVLPSRTFGDPAPLTFFTHKGHRFGVQGTLADWQNNVAARALGNSLPMFSIMAAFAGPLHRDSGVDSGGFQFTADTSSGKTSCAIAGGSVWGGGGDNGFSQTWLTTENALDAIAASHSETFLVLDETGLAKMADGKKANVIFQAIYRLASGQTKRRHTDGEEPANWRLLYLSTSEHSLAELARQSGYTLDGGELVRHVDIPVDAGVGYGVFETLGDDKNSELVARKLKGAALEYYGAPAEAFLERLVAARRRDSAGVARAVERRMNHYMSLVNVDGHDGPSARIARRFALIYAAGRLACRYGILPWSRSDMERAVLWVHKRSQRRVNLPSPLAEVARAISENFGSLVDADREEGTPLAPGYRRKRKGTTEVLLTTGQFGTLLGGEANVPAAVEALREQGYLKVFDDGKNGITWAPPGRTRRRHYCIDAGRLLSDHPVT